MSAPTMMKCGLRSAKLGMKKGLQRLRAGQDAEGKPDPSAEMPPCESIPERFDLGAHLVRPPARDNLTPREVHARGEHLPAIMAFTAGDAEVPRAVPASPLL